MIIIDDTSDQDNEWDNNEDDNTKEINYNHDRNHYICRFLSYYSSYWITWMWIWCTLDSNMQRVPSQLNCHSQGWSAYVNKSPSLWTWLSYILTIAYILSLNLLKDLHSDTGMGILSSSAPDSSEHSRWRRRWSTDYDPQCPASAEEGKTVLQLRERRNSYGLLIRKGCLNPARNEVRLTGC